MAARQWAQQWARLVRQEAELGAWPDQAREAARAPGAPGSARAEVGAPTASLQYIRAQVDRQLAALQALQVSAAGQAPGLDQRLQQCGAALAQLATACASQLQELGQLEVQLEAEYNDASASVQRVLAVPQTGRLSSSGGTSGPAHAGPAPAPSSSLPSEVMAYDAFLQRHGPTGGWHPDDHAEFERILKACRGNYAHATQLCVEQLGLLHGAEDIAQHARWHEELQRLALAKRLAVQRWRLAKQAEQASLLATAAEGATERAQQEQTGADGAANQVLQQQQRVAVAEWRAARERARVEALQRQAAEEEERRQREAAARLRRQQENRQLLLQRQQQRREQEVAQKHALLSEESTGASGSNRSLGPDEEAARRRLRDRNQQLLERRAAAVRRRSQQAAEHAVRVEQLARRASEQFAGAAERDPGRLLQATSATALRQLAAMSEERAQRDSGHIRHLPRRATPSWCAGARLQ